ncbi:YciI family protein [Jatrophihabitans sp.]|uniref:YciI family protein n=1 Tax=Jatrophihabitans sp. TaxID=1932789 RepID=UPI002C23836E|nr:YciI family protein [Jatrophihabitans sp.]
MKYLVTYQRVPGSESLIVEYLPAHRDHFMSYHQRGVLLAIGPLRDPANGEALAIFTSREAAEEFVAGDPFMVHGIASCTIRAWQDVLQPGEPG